MPTHTHKYTYLNMHTPTYTYLHNKTLILYSVAVLLADRRELRGFSARRLRLFMAQNIDSECVCVCVCVCVCASLLFSHALLCYDSLLCSLQSSAVWGEAVLCCPLHS